MGDSSSFTREGMGSAVSRRDTMKLGAASLVGMILSGGASATRRSSASSTAPGTTAASNGAANTTGSDRIREFAEWAAELDLSDVPDDVVEKTELQIGNVLATALAGRKSENVDVPVSGHGSTVVGGGQADIHDAIFANTTYGIRNDYGSYMFAGHCVYGSVFPALAACEQHGLGADTFVENVIVANEISGRLGGSALVGPNNGQLVIFIHAVAAAVINARIETDGDVDAIDNAVRIALYCPNNPLFAGLMDGDAKWFTASIPATTGSRLGRMAAAGTLGASRALADFHDNEVFLPFPELVEGWGEAWVTRSLGYKADPGAAYVLAPLEAYRQIMAEEGLEPDDVEKIEIEVPILASATEGMTAEFASDQRLDPIAVNYSISNTLGLQAVEGDVRTEYLTKENLAANEDEIRAFADKIEVEHEWGQTVDTIDALSSGIDFKPLIKERGLIESVIAVGQMDQAYEPVDSTAEALSLLASKEADDLLFALGQLGWSEFDMAKADFDAVDFSFGATVHVITETGGWWSSDEGYERSLATHSGGSARPDAEKREVVREKFERHYGDNFDVIDNLHAGDLQELTDLL